MKSAYENGRRERRTRREHPNRQPLSSPAIVNRKARTFLMIPCDQQPALLPPERTFGSNKTLFCDCDSNKRAVRLTSRPARSTTLW